MFRTIIDSDCRLVVAVNNDSSAENPALHPLECGLVAHRLGFVCETQSVIKLITWPGPSVRGALFHALRADFCLRFHPSNTSGSVPACPICALMATTDEANERGVEVPRPFTIEPPRSPSSIYMPGQIFEFGITLFGRDVELFPFVNSAVQRMGQVGLGLEHPRGRFRLQESYADNSVTGYRHRLTTADEACVIMPDLPIAHAAVLERAARLPRDVVALE